MPDAQTLRKARAPVRAEGDTLEVSLEGAWTLGGRPPRWADVLPAGGAPARVRVSAPGLDGWDTSVLLFLADARAWCAGAGAALDLGALPERMRTLAGQFDGARAPEEPPERGENLLAVIGLAGLYVLRSGGEILHFVGDCSLGLIRLVLRPHRFRWRDCLDQMQQSGAMALPIVSLISFLVGVTISYSGAVVLSKFGGSIWIADIVGISMAREMAAMMTGIVMAGRTGAAFAAQIGAMKSNEEIDALATIGVPPVRFLVLPRIIALAVMMPMLTAYAACLGVLGGMAVARVVLDIPPAGFWVELLSAVTLRDLMVGLIKAATFGLIVGLAGCLRGLQAERSAEGVGTAATSAVVTSILLIIVADAVFAVIFHLLGV